jgi:FkbM family methyltransferase
VKLRLPARCIRLWLLRARKLSRLFGHGDYWSAFIRGVLPATEHQDSGLRRDASTILDVGASRGQFALFARRRWPKARIVCFEPIPEAAEKLHEVLGNSVTLHRTALGAQEGTRLLNLSQSDDSSSLLTIGRQAREFRGTAGIGTIPVDVRRLSDYLDSGSGRPVVLKIDVQGYELEVLRGANESLQYVDEVLCECSFVELYDGQPLAADVVCYLRRHGFRLVHVGGITTADSGEQLQADLLFRKT